MRVSKTYYWKLSKRILNFKRGGKENFCQIPDYLEFQGSVSKYVGLTIVNQRKHNFKDKLHNPLKKLEQEQKASSKTRKEEAYKGKH